MFTNIEKYHILQDFLDIAENKNALTKYPLNKFVNATIGMHLEQDETKNKEELYANVMHAYEDGNFPIVHDDSLTAWGNEAAEKYGLEIRDILNMEFGQKMKVILMDRNAGEYFGKVEKGQIRDLRQGFTVAEYIHARELNGILNMYEFGGVHENFQWEINLKSIGDKNCFWIPIPNTCNIKNLNPKIKVDWRGPTIDQKFLNFLPKKNNMLQNIVG